MAGGLRVVPVAVQEAAHGGKRFQERKTPAAPKRFLGVPYGHAG
jgi:hypothetical protein